MQKPERDEAVNGLARAAAGLLGAARREDANVAAIFKHRYAAGTKVHVMVELGCEGGLQTVAGSVDIVGPPPERKRVPVFDFSMESFSLPPGTLN